MEQLVELLVEWGPMGMFVAAFLAGSFFPFSSEVVMLTLLAAGASPAGLLTIGFFLLVLVFGLAYAWRKGALEWK